VFNDMESSHKSDAITLVSAWVAITILGIGLLTVSLKGCEETTGARKAVLEACLNAGNPPLECREAWERSVR
jgi:hypothetical protein